jgi:DNA-binding response OmpR family regulator
MILALEKGGSMGDKILVVEDEFEIRDLLSRFLTEQGYEAILASNGEEAIEVAEKENPQAILLDIMMPGIDGIETCKRLKAKEKTRFIPVIMATALWDRYMEAVEAGAEDFVTKPFNLTELSHRVKSILRVRYLTNELERAVAYIRELGKNLPKP